MPTWTECQHARDRLPCDPDESATQTGRVSGPLAGGIQASRAGAPDGQLEAPAGACDALATLCGRLRRGLDGVGELVCATDPDGRCRLINLHGAGALGKSVEQVLGSDDQALLGVEDARQVTDLDRAVIGDGQSRTRERVFQFLGAPFAAITTAFPWRTDEGEWVGVSSVVRDVTETCRRRCAADRESERMRAMAAAAVIRDEDLRRALAAEIHDGLRPVIVPARLAVASLANRVGEDWHSRRCHALRVIDVADESLRSITTRLSPSTLQELGLVMVLEWPAEDFSLRHGLAVAVVEHEFRGDAAPSTKNILFRSVRALLQNVVDQAATGSAHVVVDSVGCRVRVCVRDSGVDFDATAARPADGRLFATDQQILNAAGEFEVCSTPDHGCAVTLTIPIDSARVP